MLPDRVIGRLSLYRRLLKDAQASGQEHIFSHDLAHQAHGTAAQVRRDIMAIGYSGSPAKGYDVSDLLETINHVLDAPSVQKIALVGVGNLGRALLSYFVNRHPQFTITAAFDANPDMANRIIHGCACYPPDMLEPVVEAEGIQLAIIAVPAEAAQDAANHLYKAGIRGVMNFAPVRLWAPERVYIENLDMTLALERVAYYARTGPRKKGMQA